MENGWLAIQEEQQVTKERMGAQSFTQRQLSRCAILSRGIAIVSKPQPVLHRKILGGSRIRQRIKPELVFDCRNPKPLHQFAEEFFLRLQRLGALARDVHLRDRVHVNRGISPRSGTSHGGAGVLSCFVERGLLQSISGVNIRPRVQQLGQYASVCSLVRGQQGNPILTGLSMRVWAPLWDFVETFSWFWRPAEAGLRPGATCRAPARADAPLCHNE